MIHETAIIAPGAPNARPVIPPLNPPSRQSAAGAASHHLAEINCRADRLISQIERSRARELARRWGRNAALGLCLPVLAS